MPGSTVVMPMAFAGLPVTGMAAAVRALLMLQAVACPSFTVMAVVEVVTHAGRRTAAAPWGASSKHASQHSSPDHASRPSFSAK